MTKFLSFIITFIYMPAVLACPNCAGSSNAQDKYTYIILGIFILLVYIPYMVIYRLIKNGETQNS